MNYLNTLRIVSNNQHLYKKTIIHKSLPEKAKTLCGLMPRPQSTVWRTPDIDEDSLVTCHNCLKIMERSKQ